MSGSFSKRQSAANRPRRGYVLVFGALLMITILIPAVGLAIDVGLMYLAQSVLSAAVDAAAVAGARALSRGSDDATQRANAESTANTYFLANFPPGYLASSNVKVTSTAATDATSLRSITTTASADLPLIFLRAFHIESKNIQVTSKATRRDINIIFVMDRSGSLANSGACTPLKAAAVSFVDKFAEKRDNVGLITFATSSRVDAAPSMTFKTNVEGILNQVTCVGATSSAQALWQGYQQLVGLNQTGALNAILFFTDGRPTAVTETFPIRGTSPCNDKSAKLAVLTLGYNGSTPSNPYGLYMKDAPAQPFVHGFQDLTVITTTATNCKFVTYQNQVDTDVSNAPLTDYWGNSLTATGYRSTTTSGTGLSVTSPQNIENFSINAADHAALRIRRGDADPAQGNKSVKGVVIYTIGLGDIDATLLKRMANDPSLTPNPVAAGNQGRYVYAADSTDLDLAFTRVASELLRIAQ